MSIQLHNSKQENKIDRTLKALPYKQNKEQFLEDAVDYFIEGLYKERILKMKIQ